MINNITNVVDNELLCRINNELSNGKEQANKDIKEYYLLNEKKNKEEKLINNLIKINKMKNENEFLEDIILNNVTDYNKIIGICKKKDKCMNLLMKHLNQLSKQVNISNGMLQELQIERITLMEKILDNRNTLDNLRM